MLELDQEFVKKVIDIQENLKVPKAQLNSFANYRYRNAEDILEEAKPLCIKHGVLLYLTDILEMKGDRYYIKAIATITDGKNTLAVEGYAREEENKKGQDGSQITGSSSSYARKYALNGLFCIDDTKDSDTTNKHDSGKTNSYKKDSSNSSGSAISEEFRKEVRALLVKASGGKAQKAKELLRSYTIWEKDTKGKETLTQIKSIKQMEVVKSKLLKELETMKSNDETAQEAFTESFG